MARKNWVEKTRYLSALNKSVCSNNLRGHEAIAVILFLILSEYLTGNKIETRRSAEILKYRNSITSDNATIVNESPLTSHETS